MLSNYSQLSNSGVVVGDRDRAVAKIIEIV